MSSFVYTLVHPELSGRVLKDGSQNRDMNMEKEFVERKGVERNERRWG